MRRLARAAALPYAAAVVLFGVAPPSASASVCVTSRAERATLRVNAAGTAEVAWRDSAGARRYAVIPARGRCAQHGVRMQGRDVSERVRSVGIPFATVVKRTPDGARWALQRWRRRLDAPPELRFSRWRGAPARPTADAGCCRRGRPFVRGQVTYHGRAVVGARVYIDALRSRRNRDGWARISAPRTGSNGRYRFVVPSDAQGSKYRVTLLGPNVGWVRAPDMRVFAR